MYSNCYITLDTLTLDWYTTRVKVYQNTDEISVIFLTFVFTAVMDKLMAAVFRNIAQTVEHLAYIQRVPGSIPGVPTDTQNLSFCMS